MTKLSSILLIFSVIGCGKETVTDKADSDQAVPTKSLAKEDQQASQVVHGQVSWYGPGHYGNKTARGDTL